MATLILIGLGAGVVTAITPCVLPVLPILLAGGATGRKPLRIITGLVASFAVFTLFATWILNELGLPQDLLRNIAIALLFVVALTLLVPRTALLLERPFAGLTRFRAGGGGFVLGASLGLVFVPCAGPVLAYVTARAATYHFGWRVIVLTLAYAVGAALPMLAIAYGGRGVGARLRTHAQTLRYVAGAVVAVVALGFVFNLDTRFQTALPGYTQSLQNWIEGSHAAKKALGERTPPATAGTEFKDYGVAPALRPDGDWFNSKPLTLPELHGKVVLLDFWTYSCINCLRTLPHLKAWYATYHRAGLDIIGVHTPEFAFEHVASNVGAAVKRLGIPYPVFQDNAYGTWNAYANEYWPADYLIDQRGHIREVDFGEGNYSRTEYAIRQLLHDTHVKATQVADATPTGLQTPESYLGFERLARYVGSKIHPNAFATYTLPTAVPQNSLAYDGRWKVEGQRIVAGEGARLVLHFHARDVYLVLGGRGRVDVAIDGKPAPGVTVNAYRLYTLRSTKQTMDALLQLRFTPGVVAYAFTFG